MKTKEEPKRRLSTVAIDYSDLEPRVMSFYEANHATQSLIRCHFTQAELTIIEAALKHYDAQGEALLSGGWTAKAGRVIAGMKGKLSSYLKRAAAGKWDL